MLTGLDLRASLKRRHFYYLAGLTFICSIYFVFFLQWRAFSDIIDVSSPEEAETVVPPDVQAEVPAEDSETPPLPAVQGLPPLYSQFHDAELRLPQQDWNQSRPGPDEKFFTNSSFKNSCGAALGWGNAVQEHILNAYLAYKAGRSFVFGNFTWNDDGSLYSDYENTGKLIPSQIPYSVLLRGSIVGDRFPQGVRAPLAVSKTYFDHLCPSKLDLSRAEIHANLSSPNSVAEITEEWVSVLEGLDEPCVQSAPESGPIYTHHDVFGVRTALVDVWPDLKRSPFITHFAWSPLVELAFDTNRDLLFLPAPSTQPPLSSEPYTSTPRGTRRSQGSWRCTCGAATTRRTAARSRCGPRTL
ncbi:hypothetical protein NUW54_g11298 [Trametes sanguinea]|uniref:Uncharacterized protein n=1 Tax=Trametes sanguinea TaxID=158606 RepID=A0ACC1NHD9_9APHY|nr:hypothetical protein NUW54_g11298 [Trametes sanguinea]